MSLQDKFSLPPSFRKFETPQNLVHLPWTRPVAPVFSLELDNVFGTLYHTKIPVLHWSCLKAFGGVGCCRQWPGPGPHPVNLRGSRGHVEILLRSCGPMHAHIMLLWEDM